MTAAPSANQNSQRRGPIGDALRARGGVLRLGDQPLDAGEGGLIARRGHFDAQTRVGGDGAGGDRVADRRARRGGTRR